MHLQGLLSKRIKKINRLKNAEFYKIKVFFKIKNIKNNRMESSFKKIMNKRMLLEKRVYYYQ